MRVMPAVWIAVLILVSCAWSARTGAAEEPRYVILPPPSGVGYVMPADPPRYAYGWFGVFPRKHWTRHFGYYRSYTQWKSK